MKQQLKKLSKMKYQTKNIDNMTTDYMQVITHLHIQNKYNILICFQSLFSVT